MIQCDEECTRCVSKRSRSDVMMVMIVTIAIVMMIAMMIVMMMVMIRIWC